MLELSGQLCYKGIAPVFFTAYITSSLMWYGSVSAALELFGPNRYHQDIEGRYSSVNSMLLNKAGILIDQGGTVD